jgi:hypothetical protein
MAWICDEWMCSMNFDSTPITYRSCTPSTGAVSAIVSSTGQMCTVRNVGNVRITQIQINMPNVTGILGNMSASVLTGVYGGTRGTMVSGLWDTNGCHAPITVWEDADKSGVGWLWDDNINPSGMTFWVNAPADNMPTTAQAILNIGMVLDPDQSIDIRFKTFSGAAIVDQVLTAYREQCRATLAANGVKQGSPVKAVGKWMSSGWNVDPAALANSVSTDFTRLMMWSPPDGQGWYEYLQPRLAWWPKQKFAATIPIGGMGSPAGSPRIDQSFAAWDIDKIYVPNRALPVAIQTPDVRAYGVAVRNAFIAAGIDICYWDIGQPYGGTIYDLMQVHQEWKAAGVPLMTEAYSPLTSLVSGIAFRCYYGGYLWDSKTWTREIHNAVCPSVPFIAQLNGDASTPVTAWAENGVLAWDDMADAGLIPMVPDWLWAERNTL